MSCVNWNLRSTILLSNVVLAMGACSSDIADASAPRASALAACRQRLGTGANGGAECEDEARCAVVREAPSKIYSYAVNLHSVEGSGSAKEVFDCAVMVMEAVGASIPPGDDASLLQVRGTYLQLTEALSWGVTTSWLPICASDAECYRCSGYTPSDCAGDPFCSTIYGMPIVGGVKGARVPIGCTVRECDPVETTARDPNGACWAVACVPVGWSLDTDNLCRRQ